MMRRSPPMFTCEKHCCDWPPTMTALPDLLSVTLSSRMTSPKTSIPTVSVRVSSPDTAREVEG